MYSIGNSIERGKALSLPLRLILLPLLLMLRLYILSILDLDFFLFCFDRLSLFDLIWVFFLSPTLLAHCLRWAGSAVPSTGQK